METLEGAVLNKLYSLGKQGQFLIVEIDELYDSFPDGMEKNRINLDSALTHLKQNGFIDIRYNKGNSLCLCTTAKQEEQYLEKKEQPKINWMPLYLSFAGAFLGGVFAVIIAVIAI